MSSASKSHLYFSAGTASLTGALFGYPQGLIGGLIILPGFLSYFDLSSLPEAQLATVQARIVSIWVAGALLGVPLGIPICGKQGRKTCLAVCAMLYALGAVLELFAGRLWVFELGRALNGIGVGMGTLVGPMYISEVSTAEDRGVLMSGFQLILQIAALAGFWMAFAANAIFSDTSSLQWRVPLLFQLIPGVLLLIGIIFIPETPSFLASKSQWQQTTDSLSWLRNRYEHDQDLLDELSELRETVEVNQSYSETKRISFTREAIKPANRKRLFVGVGLMVAQNLAGMNGLNYYAPVIFQSAGFTTVSSTLFLTGIFGFVKVISAVAFMLVFVRILGNRFWLKLGSALCGACMFALAYAVREILGSSEGQPLKEGVTALGGLAILSVYLFALAFGVSLGPISWNICAEIFPLHLNAKCCAITTCTQWLFQIFIAAMTPLLLASVGWVTYFMFGCFCFSTLAFVVLFVPETRGVPLGRVMDELFETPEEVKDIDEVVDEADEINEETALLQRVEARERQRRRSSLAAPV